MLDYATMIAVLGVSLLWAAWRDAAEGNKQDGALLGGLGIFTLIGSAGVFMASN